MNSLLTTTQGSPYLNHFATLCVAMLLLFAANLAQADDTEVYTDLQQCATVSQENYRFVFIVDNSGSMSSGEFIASKATIDATITEVLNSDLENIEVAIVQYGSQPAWRCCWSFSSVNHSFEVTVPFTSDVTTALNWNRRFGRAPGSGDFHQDHQPASLAAMRRAGVYGPGQPLDVTDATNVQFVFFTDAGRDWSGSGCCSSIVRGNTNIGNLSLGTTYAGFGEYDALKRGDVLPNGLKAQFTLLHVSPGGAHTLAGAAIASPGGNYVGAVEFNAGDPEGPGTTPRRYVQGTFDVNGDSSRILELIQQVIEEIQTITFTGQAPAISVNAFNQLRHRNELYFSVFQPTTSPKWNGNVKKYVLSNDGVLVDANGNPAIDPNSGSISETAQSFWSSEADGPIVEKGGFREHLTNARTVYTEISAFEGGTGNSLVSIQSDSDIKYSALGLGDETAGVCLPGPDDEVSNTLTISDALTTVEDQLLARGGTSVVLDFDSSGGVFYRLEYATDSGGSGVVCEATVAASPPSRTCSGTLPANATNISLSFQSMPEDTTSLVDYTLRYNFTPSTPSAAICGTNDDQRTDLINWTRGVDVYNEDGDLVFTDPHNFAADPLHTRPFVITYSGSSVENAQEVLFESDNLGALRALDPADGTEIWSYIPEEHLDNIRRFALNKAGSPKPYGLDGRVSVVQRKAESSTPSNVLLREVTLYMGERRGGRNYYSVDVSDASKSVNNAPSLNWKIKGSTDARFSDLGQTWSAMVPAKIKTGCSDNGSGCEITEVLIFSGGYDEAYDNESSMPEGTLGNALFIVDLATGGDNFFWSVGNDNDARTARDHTLNLEMVHSFPTTPTIVDSDGDGAVDALFAIDISGVVWRIDFDRTKSKTSSSLATGGKIATLASSGELRRFFSELDVSRSNPRSGSDHFNIVVGSGYRAHPNDLTDAANRIYVLRDPFTSKRRMGGLSESSRYKYFDAGSGSARVVTVADLINYNSLSGVAEYGFYRNLTGSGEKIFQQSVTFNETIIVSSFLPATEGDESCGVGRGRTYFLDVLTGESIFSEEWVDLKRPGLPPQATILHTPHTIVCLDECVKAEEPEESSDDEEDECDKSNFDAGLQAAVNSTACGLEKGRAYRSQWRENR
ncbi:MAG: hypothetical protein AB8B48_21140 [Pseudomonadales bacterium]